MNAICDILTIFEQFSGEYLKHLAIILYLG